MGVLVVWRKPGNSDKPRRGTIVGGRYSPVPDPNYRPGVCLWPKPFVLDVRRWNDALIDGMSMKPLSEV